MGLIKNTYTHTVAIKIKYFLLMDTETGVDNTKHKIHIITMVVNGESNKLCTPTGNVVDLTPTKKAHHPTLIYVAICRF